MKNNYVENKVSMERPHPQQNNYLMYLPRKKHLDWKVEGNLIKLIFHHDRMAERFLRWLVNKPLASDLELDKAGSIVWLAIDGHRTVYEIWGMLNQEFGTNYDPDYKRLILFLNYLNKKGWIAFSNSDRTPQ